MVAAPITFTRFIKVLTDQCIGEGTVSQLRSPLSSKINVRLAPPLHQSIHFFFSLKHIIWNFKVTSILQDFLCSLQIFLLKLLVFSSHFWFSITTNLKEMQKNMFKLETKRNYFQKFQFQQIIMVLSN